MLNRHILALLLAGTAIAVVPPTNTTLSPSTTSSTTCTSITGKPSETVIPFVGYSWRYAGMESGGECWWGDVAISPDTPNQQDCDIPCGGDKFQACGGENRLVYYTDVPSRLTLAFTVEGLKDVLEQLETQLDRLQSLTDYDGFKGLVDQYDGATWGTRWFWWRGASALLELIKDCWGSVELLTDEIKRLSRPTFGRRLRQGRRYGKISDEESGSAAELEDMIRRFIDVAQDLGPPIQAALALSDGALLASALQLLTTNVSRLTRVVKPNQGKTIFGLSLSLWRSLKGALSLSPCGSERNHEPTDVCQKCQLIDSFHLTQPPPALGTRKVHYGRKLHVLETRTSSRYSINSIGGMYGAHFSVPPQPELEFCWLELMAWNTKPYPPASRAQPDEDYHDPVFDDAMAGIRQDDTDDFTTGAALMPGIGSLLHPGERNVYIDFQPVMGQDRVCHLELVTSKTPGTSVYNTDHVFENHIVKDFLYWIYQRYPDDMDCGGLQGIFFRNGNDQNGVIDQIMEALSYWNEDDGRTYELFVLNQDLNAFKSMMMHGRPLDEPERAIPVLPRPSEQKDCFLYLEYARLVMNYLDNPFPKAAYNNVRKRVYNFLAGPDFHTSRGYQDGPSMSTGGPSWAQEWETFTEKWIVKRQKDIQEWVEELSTDATSCYTRFRDTESCDLPSWPQIFNDHFDKASDFSFPEEWFRPARDVVVEYLL